MDDTLLFTMADMDQILTLRSVLFLFEATSGLKINLSKSSILGVGDYPDIGEMVAIMQVINFPLTYLGLPLGAKYKSIELWNPMIEKFEKILATWKGLYLSIGNKLMILKSVLINLLVHFLALFSLLRKVLDKLEQIQCNFLWDSFEGDKKMHLVRWNQFCRLTEQGGLGIVWSSR